MLTLHEKDEWYACHIHKVFDYTPVAAYVCLRILHQNDL
jgi:hypothetical protein